MLKFALFENFLGRDTLLFDGSAVALESFSSTLRSIAEGRLTGQIHLDESNGFEPYLETLTTIDVVATSANSAVAERSGQSTLVTWRLGSSNAIQVEQLVRNVAAYPEPGHEYLEESGEIQIMVAKGEYPPEVFERRR